MQVKRKRLIPKPDIVIQMLWNVWDMKNGMQMFSPKSSAKGSPVIIDAMGKAKKKEQEMAKGIWKKIILIQLQIQ